MKTPPQRPYKIQFEGDTKAVLTFEKRLDVTNTAEHIRLLHNDLFSAPLRKLVIDLKNIEIIDDYGVLILFELKTMLDSRKGQLEIINVPQKAKDLFSLTGFPGIEKGLFVPKGEREGIIVHLGSSSIKIFDDLRAMTSFVGDVFLSFIYIFLHPRRLRWGDTLTYMQRTGVDALPIVGLISFLLGLIMAFMSSVQLEQFGANIYVASLVALAMTRELGPIMTAIIIAGRSGSAFASEIGSMIISEEVDALKTMGFNTTRFIVLPKMVASLIVVPILTLFSDFFAILGGLLIGITMLDLTSTSYINKTMSTLEPFDITWGLFKSTVFALLISLTGCFRGFQTKGGADSVGRATTSAVVSGIFLIILFDSIFAVILTYW